MEGGGRSSSPKPNALVTLERNIHHHVTQAILSLPFAHVSGVKELPVLQSLEQWHHNALAPHLASISSRLGSQVRALEKAVAVGYRRQQAASSSRKTAEADKQRAERATSDALANSCSPIVCIELTKGHRRVYRRVPTATGSAAKGSRDVAEIEGFAAAAAAGFIVADDRITHRRRLRDGFADYLLPQGYPDSVAPQYATYMGWRGVQYFFGGAMSVFTTRSLLRAVGVANRHSGEAAAAINWVVKDGAGRLGRFLFARWGRSLDGELKQFRLAGDVLMELGAALELSTALAPRLFLPLACTANLSKNLAAVAASSTRAPIYRTFARQNNLADVTAKGESVANLADMMGTACGILLSRGELPIVTTFALLSVGYLIASRKEVDSVELPYLNRARLSYVTKRLLGAGVVPGPAEANDKETLLPWRDPSARRIVLGATVEEACTGPVELKAALDAFKGRQYALTYRSDTGKVYVMLREGAGTAETLAATLDAHCVLHLVGAVPVDGGGSTLQKGGEGAAAEEPIGRNGGTVGKLRRAAEGVRVSAAPGDQAVRYVATNGPGLYRQFEEMAQREGWRLALTMLNPKETRICPV